MTRFERLLLGGSALLTGASGLIYAWMKYLLTTDDPYAVVNHPLQPLLLKIHVVTAPLLVFAIGLIFMQHVVRQWKSRRPSGRISGLTIGLLGVPMVLSGYLIQVVTAGSLLAWLIGTHLVTGTLYLVLFGVHRWRMRAGAAQRARRERDAIGAVTEAGDREECA
ncbi:MAG TPA: hypothetical protein VD788_05235 [Candidatus Polarisedimenticolaceae bacterium]|nr:hypothetical protein [Candidatus Polarisedimenticolaceae bacterium]